MSERRFWAFLLAAVSVLLALAMQMPQIRHQMDPAARGIPVQLNSDEDVYLARVSEALRGRYGQTAEAIIGDPAVQGTQPALLELLIGAAFRPTGLRAGTVLQVLDAVFPPLFFLALFLFLRLCSFNRRQSFAGAVFFVLIELYNLNRPVHQAGSALLVLLALSGIILGLERRLAFGIAGAALMGALTSVYFWSWTFAWCWFLVLVLWEFSELLQKRRHHRRAAHVLTRRLLAHVKLLFPWRHRDPIFFARWKLLLLFGLVGAACAVPSGISAVRLMRHPLSGEVVFRSGIFPSHLPESWVYSVLFLVMAGGVAAMMRAQTGQLLKHKYAAVTILTAFIVLNQQVIHGLTFKFASHYLFLLAIAAIMVVLLWVATRSPSLFFSFFAAIVYLAGIAYDGRYVLGQWRVDPGRMERQHFASAFPALDALGRSVILSDPDTSQFLAGATHHNAVYSLYLKNVLISHREMAERYCLTQLPLPPERQAIAGNDLLLFPDAIAAFRDPSLREAEIGLVMDVCGEAGAHPAEALRKYGVQYVFVDEKRQPGWSLARIGVPTTFIARGEGWSLWKVGYSGNAV